MNNNDKILAIGGVTIIVLLAIVAIFILLSGKSNSPIRVKPQVETVELGDSSEVVTQETRELSRDNIVNGPVVSDSADVKANKKDSNVTALGMNDGKYAKKNLKAVKNNDSQMKEIYDYWESGRLDAVYDLIKLKRIRNLTRELYGTNDYYYYGSVDANNNPDGLGLAIYKDDTYYFGEWKNGLREGNGYIVQMFIDGEGKVGDFEGVVEHLYTGQFKADLPHGIGQENFAYNCDMIAGEDYLYNVIGGFKNGYYDSDLIIYTIDKSGRRYEWRATASEGSFVLCEEGKVSTTNKKPVWFKGDDNDHSTDESDNGYFWLKDADNKDWGVYGLKR